MNAKQVLMDILVILIVPVLLVAGYHFLWPSSNDDTTLLSKIAPQWAVRPSETNKNLGVKVKAELAELDSIQLNGALFTDEAFLTLKERTVVIATSSLGRPYPFTRPDEVTKVINKTKQVKERETNKELSSKIDHLKTMIIK